MLNSFELLRKRDKTNEEKIRNWILLSMAAFVQKEKGNYFDSQFNQNGEEEETNDSDNVLQDFIIWSLSCLFVAASTNQFILSLFPTLTANEKAVTNIDMDIFFTSAVHFYQYLGEEEKKEFIRVFAEVDHYPFSKLVSICTDIMKKDDQKVIKNEAAQEISTEADQQEENEDDLKKKKDEDDQITVIDPLQSNHDENKNNNENNSKEKRNH